jgi:N-acetylneuraminic acid mutarotase
MANPRTAARAITRTIVVLSLHLVVGAPLQAQQEVSLFHRVGWYERASPPSPLYAHTLVAVDGKLYAIGGRTGSAGDTNLTFEYDIRQDVWTAKADMPTRRSNHASVAARGKIHVLGGNLFKTSHEVYDPATDTWTTSRPLPTGLQHINSSAAFANGGIYVVGGIETGGHVTGRTLRYDLDTDRWEDKPPMGAPRSAAAVVHFDNQIYVIGGQGEGYESLATVEAYDPLRESWDVKAPMPEPHAVAGAAVIGRRILVITGIRGWETTSRIFIYDPESDEWSVGPDLPVALRQAGVATMEGKLYVVGGANNDTIFAHCLEATVAMR